MIVEAALVARENTLLFGARASPQRANSDAAKKP